MVGPIWSNKITDKMSKPQSKMEIQENTHINEWKQSKF